MQFGGEASNAEQALVHRALIDGTDQEFIDVALPFVRYGIESGDPTLVVVQEGNVRNLREALGDFDGATLLPVSQWYETSARTRDKFRRWAVEHLNGGNEDRRPTGNRVRLVGEPPWAVGNEARVRDWARHESVINVAFDGLPVSFICPYDARALPDQILEHAASTHPEVIADDRASRSVSYQDPREFCRRLDAAVRAPRGSTVAEFDFALGDLPVVRRIAESAAAGAGLSAARVGEIVLAVNEIATNAVIHGRSPVTLRIWTRSDEIVFEVTDAGEGIGDALAGQLRPAPEDLGGRGLWLTRLLSDALEIRNGEGCTVSIHAAAPTPS